MATYDFGRSVPAALTPSRGQVIRTLWLAYAATPGARCPECNAAAVETLGDPVTSHAGYCRLAELLRSEP